MTPVKVRKHGQIPGTERHAPAKSRQVLKDARGREEIMERDVAAMLVWLNGAPLRTITSQGMNDWINSQEPPWTHAYSRAVRERVQVVMTEATSASAEDVKARLLHLVDSMMPLCREHVTSGGELVPDRRTAEWKAWSTEHTRQQLMVDPLPNVEDKMRLETMKHAIPFLDAIDHTAVQGYVNIMGKLCGVMVDKSASLHLHAQVKAGDDLSELPFDKLVAIATRKPKGIGHE
jgi:hypothetical protein